jgi:hypothetical protein
MTQQLEGVDIYDCPFFEVDSNGSLKFISGNYYGRTPETFKTIDDAYDVLRFCMWIIKKKSTLEVSKYAAIVYLNRVNEKLQKIEKQYRKMLIDKQISAQENLNNSINTSGTKYI